MARLARWKYVPMLFRAYQEARDRTRVLQTENVHQTSDTDIAYHRSSENVKSSRPGERGAQQNSSSQTQPNKRPIRRGSKLAKGHHTALQRASKTKLRAGAKTPAVRSKPKARQRNQSARLHSRGTQVSLQHVWSELRATKQQLSQLRAIQMQLNQVQAQLDEQFKTLSKHAENTFEDVAEAEETVKKAANTMEPKLSPNPSLTPTAKRVIQRQATVNIPE